MASNVKVNKITPTSACGTITLGDSGDTISIPSGASLNIGGSVSGIEGIVNWDTTAKTTGFTAVAGNGYFVNTTSGAITVTLPATPTAGDLVAVKDYALTAQTNNITLGRNGSNIQGVANDFVINTQGRSVTLIYVDGTQGWMLTGASQASDIVSPQFIIATGGTITTCGDYKIHTFTGPGTFCVSQLGNPSGGPSSVDYLVVAGGAGGGGSPSTGGAGGGGAGGFRLSATTFSNTGPSSPRSACVAALPLSVTAYPITVGAGGGGGPQGSNGCAGSNSIFSTITSAGGGAGTYGVAGGNGGSGGGSGNGNPGGSGNTPPVSPPQGMPSASSAPGSGSGGGGALVAAGASSACCGSPGGAGGGIPTAFGISGQPSGGYYYFSGGGGGNVRLGAPGTVGIGGLGGGSYGKEYTCSPACNATVNTGGGGGGGHGGGAGGSGIVIIRYKYQ